MGSPLSAMGGGGEWRDEQGKGFEDGKSTAEISAENRRQAELRRMQREEGREERAARLQVEEENLEGENDQQKSITDRDGMMRSVAENFAAQKQTFNNRPRKF